MSEEPPLVLVVEDENDLADLYATWLTDGYRVRTAYGGEQALDLIDEEVDVVLLDRRMPGVSGDDFLQIIREEGYDCRVAMVTAVEPDFDIIEMGFDDYLVKPVTNQDLHDMVSTMVARDDYDTSVQELYSLSSKKALLEAEKEATELADNSEYQELRERVEKLQQQLDQQLDSLESHEDFASMYRDLDQGPARQTWDEF